MTPPLLALTVGDPAGIGPEIALRYLARGAPPATLLIVCDGETLERARAVVPEAPPLPVVASPAQLAAEGHAFARLATSECPVALPTYGAIDPEAGRVSHAWVVRAARLSMAGELAGLVTGPVNKEAWNAAGVRVPGHTEVLQAEGGVERVLMLLVGDRLRTALATVHVPLRSVAERLEVRELTARLQLLATTIADGFGPDRPRIAVCGLNPHAGEGGLFGHEDAEIIAPAVAAAVDLGIDAVGPLPADACIPAAAGGAYDAVLAMYHDQALPAVKTLAPRSAVNVTLGLPFVRTSVDHGTAFDIAGRGIATDESLAAAVDLAASMVTRQRTRARGQLR